MRTWSVYIFGLSLTMIMPHAVAQCPETFMHAFGQNSSAHAFGIPWRMPGTIVMGLSPITDTDTFFKMHTSDVHAVLENVSRQSVTCSDSARSIRTC